MKVNNIIPSLNNAKAGRGSYFFPVIVFITISAWWLYEYNRYHILSYLEEQQLFRTDYFYFQDYMSRPGGLAQYISSFITQFYCVLPLGAVLLSTIIAFTYLLFIKICRKDGSIYKFSAIAYAVPLFLLISCTDVTNVQLSHIVGLAVPLALFAIYIGIKGCMTRYVLGALFYLISYFISGGNAFIFISLLIISELFNNKASYLYIFFCIIICVSVPFAAHKFIYVAKPEVAYLSLTPFNTISFNIHYFIAWLSVPVLYLAWQFILHKMLKVFSINPKVITSICAAAVVFGAVFLLKNATNHEAEQIAQMAYQTERGNWDKVLELGNRATIKDSVTSVYFTNIALSEKGELASKMFYFKQTGTYGEFITWKIHYETIFYIGELYYRLGIIQEAEHCAYETLVLSRTEHGSKALRRLVYTSMLLRDEKSFERYINLFEKSPVYASWAKDQRAHFEKYLNDSTYKIPNTPEVLHTSDLLIDYWHPETIIENILETNKGNKKAFEYLIASHLLSHDLNNFYKTMERYYADMNYNEMPRHIQEALLMASMLLKLGEDEISKYNIEKSVSVQFEEFNDLFYKTLSDKSLNLQLEKRFGNTYFYYYLNAQPILMADLFEKSQGLYN